MKTLKFRYAGAWNFLPFGPDGIELYFDDYGQVVRISGLNLDMGTEACPASNGSGKSSIQDIISYAIYGQTVKRPKKLDHNKIINKITGKKLLVEVQFDDYRIVRGREPNKLDVWCSKDRIWDQSTRVTKGTASLTQDFIDGLVGLSHIAFCNVVVFDDSNSYSFLELDTAGKRKVIENLLGLDRYLTYHEVAKDIVKEHKAGIRDLTRDLESLQQSIKEADARIVKVNEQQAAWTRNKQNEIYFLREKMTGKQKILGTYDCAVALAEYNSAQQQASDLMLSIDSIKLKKEKYIVAQNDGRNKLAEARAGLRSFEDNLQKHRLEYQRLRTETLEAHKIISQLNNLEDGTTCPTCSGRVARENYASILHHQKNVMAASEAGYRKEELLCKEASEKVEKRKELIIKMQMMINESEKIESNTDNRIREETKEMNRLLKVPKPAIGEQERALEVEIVAIKRQIEEKQGEINGISPYKEILEHTEIERREKFDERTVKSQALEAAEKLLPYREWWVYAFGDKGIRKYLVDKVIPALNSRIAYWLQYLIDSKIQLSFDNELNESITRNGIDADYHAMSNGEKQRINLAVSQGFAYVMILNSGHCPSFVFLDEVTGGSIDTAGVTGIYNMIYELAKERQVLVTTHNQALLRMLEGCENIKLVKSGDITTLVK
jgi:DNA repair exonuclease SbcCD ATPase subunit